jgi:hypothetical protein
MLRPALLIAVCVAAAPALAPGPALAQRLGPGNPSCYEVQNTAPFQMLIHVTLPSRARSVARVDGQQRSGGCIAGELFPDGEVNFRIVSGLGLPLFSCQTKIDRPIVVSAVQKSDGSWDYAATCRR